MAQAQEYTVKEWKPWENEDGLIRDMHGNYKGSVTFEEDNAEPIDAAFKTQPEPGTKKYGIVDLYRTKAGRTRKGFKSASRPQEGQQPFGGPKKEWQPRDEGAIRAQFAIKTAVMAYGKPVKPDDIGNLEALAKEFYAMVDRVKGSSESTDPKATPPPPQAQAKSQTSNSQTSLGEQKDITTSAEELRAQAEAERDAEYIRNIAHEDDVYMPGDDPVNLEDIPF